MTLGELFAPVRSVTPLASDLAAREVKGVEYDSRRVEDGFVFFAFAGQHANGRRFAADAVARGAVAVAGESPRPDDFAGSWIQVEHGRQALALVSRAFYGNLDERLRLTGITGTNGKTTVAYLVDAVLRAAGHTTALIGTIEYRIAGHRVEAVNTTPESLDLNRILARLISAGGAHVTMEVSSHALALARVYGLRFHTAVFTNLTRDHLDFHHSMDEYFAAKRRLFEGAGAPPPRCCVLNRDDAYARQIPVPSGAEAFWYGFGAGSTVRASHISSSLRGLRFDVECGRTRFAVESALVGRVNVYNILAACAAGLSHGVAPETIASGIAQCRSVPGRFERIDEGQPFGVVVDYAHTDDALRNTIAMARALTPGRVVTLFGCGGDRDRTKRPLMGEVAGLLSDYVVVTSDNPRSEDPLSIINDALVGLRRRDTPHVVEPNREAAIRRAIEEAHPGDIVILAGKGHETYQVLKDRTIPFDDREVARNVLRGFGYGRR